MTLQSSLESEKTPAVSTDAAVDNTVAQTVDQNKEQEPQEDLNFKAFREGRKKDRAEKEAAERRAAEKEAEIAALKAAMEAAFARDQAASQQPAGWNQYPVEESEDERIEKKVQAAIAQREAQAEKLRREREQAEYPQKLAKDFPDFHSMITAENLDYLDYHYPEVSRPLQRLGDDYEKWADIYKAVKKFVPNATTAKREAAKAEANFAKPRSISSTGLTQNTDANSYQHLTEDRKQKNWERMQRMLKGLS